MSKASSRNAAERRRRERERRCIVSREALSDAQLLRFALGPDGVVIPDVAAKLPGRGAWVRADKASISEASRKCAFARAFKTTVTVPNDLAERAEALLSRRCLELLGLMRRAGAVAIGATQVEQAIRAKPLLVMIEAADGAEEGREKLMSLHIGIWKRAPAAVGCFSASELGVALGRERVIHACLLQERLAQGWAAEIGRLAGFRAIVPSSWPDSWRSVGWGLGGADAGSIEVQSRGGQQDI
jgi:predicted RNA-binding protein YlxR (DUF448 family)